jgi:hypothetical protein
MTTLLKTEKATITRQINNRVYTYCVTILGATGKMNREIYSGKDGVKAHEIYNQHA